METLDFYEVLRRMRGYRGDTFPVFYIRTDADDLTGCSMRLVLENTETPGSVALTKACTEYEFEDEALGFSVQLGTDDTVNLCGTYTMHFIMEDGNGAEYRKLVGTLVVLDRPEEVSA